jgi:hypothetical protein
MSTLKSIQLWGLVIGLGLSTAASLQAATIDGFTFSTTPGYYTTYTPGSSGPPQGFPAPFFTNIFFLSDGTTASGRDAGTTITGQLAIGTGQQSGTTVTFPLQPIGPAWQGTSIPPSDTDLALAFQDFGSGTQVAPVEAIFEYTAPLVLTANVGTDLASVSGYVEYLGPFYYLADGNPGSYPFAAQVGQLLPFTADFVLSDGTWNTNTFSDAFTYSISGSIGDVSPVPEPPSYSLLLYGIPALLIAWIRKQGFYCARRASPANFFPRVTFAKGSSMTQGVYELCARLAAKSR